LSLFCFPSEVVTARYGPAKAASDEIRFVLGELGGTRDPSGGVAQVDGKGRGTQRGARGRGKGRKENKFATSNAYRGRQIEGETERRQKNLTWDSIVIPRLAK